MKETKFRIWDKEGKFMEELVWPWALVDGEVYNITLESLSGENILLMQYIGMKDRDGKDIYIGDILRLNNKNYCPGENLYYEGIVVVQPTEVLGYNIVTIKPPPEWNFDSTSMWHVGEGDTTEIIGNIYENKELLDNNK